MGAEKDGKASEGVFEVALPVEEKDLVEAKEDTVQFTEGEVLKLECTKLEKVITELWWTCNGKKMVNGKKNIQIKNKKGFSQLILNPAEMSDEGSCTCHAKGLGTEDSVDFTVEGIEDVNEVTVTPQQTELTCKQGEKKPCSMKFDVKTDEKLGKKDVKICTFKKDKVGKCKVAKFKGGAYVRSWGKGRKPKASGNYVAVVTVNGEAVRIRSCCADCHEEREEREEEKEQKQR